jgi:hypothetical protein
VRIDYRWGAGNADNARKYATELVALAPDVILATGSSTLGPLLQTTRAVPIVFVIVPDPVGSGFVDSLARPGGNATGFLTSRMTAARVTRGAISLRSSSHFPLIPNSKEQRGAVLAEKKRIADPTKRCNHHRRIVAVCCRELGEFIQ